MDPNIAPQKSSEELTQVRDANSQQTVKTSSAVGPTQAAQEVATTTTTPTSQTVRKDRSVGMSAPAAAEYGTKKSLFQAYRIIWYVLAFIEIVLAFRFVLKLLGANPESGFTKFVYGLSSPFAGPFLNIFHASTTKGFETTSFFEWSTLVAAAVYAVVAWGIIKIFKLGKPTDPEEVEQTVASQ